jgi:hypothetical protein
MTAEQLERPGTAPEADPLLQKLVAGGYANPDFEMSITLYVSGMVVSGTVISVSAYWRELVATLFPNASPELASEAKELADSLADTHVMPGDFEVPPGEEADSGPLSNYIQLRDATVFAPGARPTLPRTLWRGRLSHVSAWSLGSISEV